MTEKTPTHSETNVLRMDVHKTRHHINNLYTNLFHKVLLVFRSSFSAELHGELPSESLKVLGSITIDDQNSEEGKKLKITIVGVGYPTMNKIYVKKLDVIQSTERGKVIIVDPFERLLFEVKTLHLGLAKQWQLLEELVKIITILFNNNSDESCQNIQTDETKELIKDYEAMKTHVDSLIKELT